ncbi:hypothetical protein H0902_06810 [Microcystis aeruginosa BLCCF108]|uniref:Uncharacterized protein n=1 Tax=Microcystis aeruginosa BLCC-F108 TaxID=2755317 RepID=A0A841UPK5_MICAE|nr:hypothetical protein [Microcystis aeruginosa]MBC1190540.1 hypothetical protein [Microcystis aeruginosa BLCC-F108]
MQWTGVIRDRTLIEKDIWRFLSIVFALERTNQLNLLPDKDLVDLCPPYRTITSNEEPLLVSSRAK